VDGLPGSPAGVPVQLYKHNDSRRYLNLDASGHAYVLRSGDDSYHLTSPAAAIDWVTGPDSSTAANVAAGWWARPAAPAAPIVQAPADPGLAL
jgi:hypothetical protein